MNQVLQMLMNQMKMKNPQVFQIVEQARRSNGNPIELFKQVTNGYKPEQIEGIFNRAKQMGVPEEYINQLKNGIK